MNDIEQGCFTRATFPDNGNFFSLLDVYGNRRQEAIPLFFKGDGVKLDRENIFYASRRDGIRLVQKFLVFVEKSSSRFSGVGKVGQLLKFDSRYYGTR